MEKTVNQLGKLFLAPMVRLGTTPFRLLCLRHGADLVFTEEIIDIKLRKCEKYYNKILNTDDFVTKEGYVVLRIHPEEKPSLILQIGSSNPSTALEACSIVKKDVRGFDVNMGCPKHFSVHGNMGSALLKFPEIAKKILENIQSLKIQTSCKIRLCENLEETKNFINTIQSTGIQFFTIHLRKKEETAQIKAQWSKMLDIVSYANIPVYANGDILCPEDIHKMIKSSNCTGVMLARGAIHNPNIFNEYKEAKFEDLENSSEFFNEYEELHFKNKIQQNQTQTSVNSKEKSSTPKKSSVSSENVQQSKNLAKIIEKKYARRKVDILPLLQEFFKIAIDTGNHVNNTKYNLLYILKTHKDHIKLFQALQACKSYGQMSKNLECEEYLKCALKSKPELEEFFEGKYYKNMLKKGDL